MSDRPIRDATLLGAALALSASAQAQLQRPSDTFGPARFDLALVGPAPRRAFFGFGFVQPAPQESAPAAQRAHSGRFEIGLSAVDVDTSSSTFRQYRVVPQGFEVPSLQASGDGKLRYDLSGRNVGRDDGWLRLRLQPGPLDVTAEYRRVPHRFGNEGRSLFERTDVARPVPAPVQAELQRVLEIQFAQRRTGVDSAFLRNLMLPRATAARPIDLALLRERGRVDLDLTRDRPLSVRLSYAVESRRGDRPDGASFGYSNAVEIPEPIDYLTQDFGAAAEWDRSWGHIRGGLHYNRFSNRIDSVTFGNPFRSTDSSDAGGFFAPSQFGIAGPSNGRLALPPDSGALTGSLGLLVKLPRSSRLTAEGSLARWTQDAPLIAYTSNSSITSPLRAADAASLPARSLDGRLTALSQAYGFTSRPWSGFTFSGRYRRYRLDNDTRRIQFPGQVYFDSIWEPFARITVPYGYTTDSLRASASYDFGRVSAEAAYAYEGWNRSFRETGRTSQDGWRLAADFRAADWATLRGSYEPSSRDYDIYLPRRGESSSYVPEKRPTLLTELRRYDQGRRDTDRWGGHLLLSPGSAATVSLSYLRGKEDYFGSQYGLLSADSEVMSAEVGYAPGERWSLDAFWSRENFYTFQRGAQRAATGAPDPRSLWTAIVGDNVDSVGGGGDLELVKEKLRANVHASYQRVNGSSDFDAPGGAVDIGAFDDTRVVAASAELTFKPTGRWSLAVGGWIEDYEVRDAATSGLPYYIPGALFLAANDGDYNGRVFYVRASYSW
jgi:hypothetical protein